MDTKHYSTLILKNYLKFSFKNIRLIILTLVIEYFLIYMETIASISRILLRLNIIDQDFSISAFSPYYLFNNMKASNCSAGYCQFQDMYFYIAVILISVLVILFLLIIVSEKFDNSHETDSVKEAEKNISHMNLAIETNNSTTDSRTWKLIILRIMKYFCVNILDFVTFKILGLLILTVIFDKITYGIKNSGTGTTSLAYLIVGVIFLVIFLFCYIFQIENINILIQFNPQLNYHYDNKFSKNYDYVLLFLKIVIALENNLYFSTIFQSTASNSNGTILFFDIIVLISILAFTLKIVYQIVTSESIFYINKRLNTCRLFFLFFNSLTFVIIFIFISSIEKSMFLLVVIVSMCIFSITAIYFLLRVQPNPIYLKDRYISQLIEILHEYFSLSLENFNTKIIKIHGIHVNYCITKNSDMMDEKCLICENMNLDHFPQNFIIQTKILVKKKLLILSRDEKCYFKFAKLISAERGWLGETEEKSLIYKTKLLLERKKFSNKNFLSNLSLFFDYVNVYDKTNETKFNLIKKFDETNQLIFSSIEKLQEVFLLFDSNSKKDFYPLALSLNTNKESIMKNIQFFMSNKNVYTDLYSMIIIRHNFEKLYNCQLGDNDTLYEMENNEEVVNDFYIKDKQINMIYSIKNNQITIFNASRQFVKYKKKSFEEIFPRNFRKYGVHNFLICLKNHYEGFNYEYIVQADNYYISSIRLTSSLLKTINLEQLMIISKFDTKKEELIIFQQFGDEHNQDYLVTFSEALSKVLFLHPKWIETIKKFNNYVMLSMNKIFDKTPVLEGVSEKEINDTNSYYPSNINKKAKNTSKYANEMYTLNYNTYYTQIYSKLIKYIKEHFDTDPLAGMYQNEIEKLANANYEIKVRISFKYQIYNNENVPCNVYSFKSRKQKKFANLGDSVNSDKMVTESINKFEDESSTKVYNRELSQYTANSQSSLGRESFSNLYTKREVEKKASELNKFTVVTLLINISIVIFCIIFLAIGLIDNKYLKDLNTLQISLKKFRSNFVNTSLNVFMSVGVYPPGTTDYSGYITNNIFSSYKNDPNIGIDLLAYLNNELTVKVDVLKAYMLAFQYNIHISNYATELEGIMLQQVQYYSISQLGDSLILSTTNVTFTDMINLLMTNGRSAVYTFNYNCIYIISFDINTGVGDLSNIYDKNITMTQRMVYELAINYPNYLKNFKLLEGSINQILESDQNRIFYQNVYLTFTLIGLHVLLIIISIVIINHLKKSTNDHNKYLVKTITPEVSKYMQSKLFILRDLNEYYNEAPSKLVSKFKILKKDFNTKFELSKKKTKNEKKDSSSSIVQKVSFSESNGKIKLDKLLAHLTRLLFGIFLVYYLYAFLFFFSFYMSYTNLTTAFDYLNLMQAVNINSVSEYVLHQTLQFTNQTDLSYSLYLVDPANTANFGIKGMNYNYVTSAGYIAQTLEILRQLNVQILKIERDSLAYTGIKTEIDTMLICSNLYSNTDEIISQFVSKYPSGNLIKGLTMFCESMDFMQTPNFDEVMQEIDYTMMQLLSDLKFANGDYVMIKQVNDENIYFLMMAVLSLIIRPAQSYVLNSVIIPLINNATSSYLQTIIIFLFCNILVDIIIFILIKQKLIKRVTEINDDIKCLLECIGN